jgi:hypothetical protein
VALRFASVDLGGGGAGADKCCGPRKDIGSEADRGKGRDAGGDAGSGAEGGRGRGDAGASTGRGAGGDAGGDAGGKDASLTRWEVPSTMSTSRLEGLGMMEKFGPVQLKVLQKSSWSCGFWMSCKNLSKIEGRLVRMCCSKRILNCRRVYTGLESS